MTITKALPGEVHTIKVDVDRWRHGLPEDAWPEGFATGAKVWRRDVFDVADRWRLGAASALQLTSAVLAWGHGITGYGRSRAAHVLNQDPEGVRLSASLKGLRQESPSEADLLEAYKQFFAGPNHLERLGPAFFTKIIYFAGYRRGAGGVQPLILDRIVAGRLPDKAGAANRYSWGWFPNTWLDYLRWAAKQSARAEYNSEPDHVEMDLFNGVRAAY